MESTRTIQDGLPSDVSHNGEGLVRNENDTGASIVS